MRLRHLRQDRLERGLVLEQQLEEAAVEFSLRGTHAALRRRLGDAWVTPLDLLCAY